ncbi:related to integral membrane protein [Cephalotrichum gorgonifer]|uniref:Related to integral membrane protein n=1 Tax=Cephalotrichum gorgonifer TaxID=2041049 RepID=A0AAE8SXU0_9PEZI|nr:related to integral membrane protein [Cephalotrichum gorgonifer]
MADAAALPPGFNDDKSWIAIFTVTLCLTVATVMVGLRVYTRMVVTKQMGMDDWAAIFTLLITYADGITIAFQTRYGLGRHIYALKSDDIMQYFKCFWLSIVLYCAGLLGAKMTFLLQYYRVLAVQKMRMVYIIAIVIVGAWGLSQFLIGVLMCRPIQGFWDKRIEATCIPNQPQFYINAAGNIATDVAVFLLPMPAIRHLNLPRTQKLLLLGVFSLGFFTVAISVIRIKFLAVTEDPTWDNIESSGWSIGELTSALTCSCLPTLRPFFSKFFPALAGSSARPTAGYKSADSEKPERSGRLFGRRRGDDADLFETKGGIEATLSERVSDEALVRQPSSDEGQLLQVGLRSTTRTVISGARDEQGHEWDERDYERGGEGPGAIQVQRDVYQTNTTRG